MKQTQLRLLIVLGFIVIAVGIVGIIGFITQSQTDQGRSYTQTESIDPASGETVIETDGKTPEKYGVNPDIPIYLGFVQLMDRGMTLDDVDEVKGFLNDFANKQISENKDKITEISLYKDSVGHKIQNNVDTYTMDFLVNRKSGYVMSIDANSNTNQKTYQLYKGTDTSTSPVHTKTTDL